MNEYNVTFARLEKGEFALDLHRSSGTSRYAKFSSIADLGAFFSSLGFDDDRLAEIEAACSNLQPGEAYHETMPFPDSAKDSFDQLLTNHASNGQSREQAQ